MLKTIAKTLIWGSVILAVAWAAGALINAIITIPLLGWTALFTFINYGLLPAFALSLTGRLLSAGLLFIDKAISR